MKAKWILAVAVGVAMSAGVLADRVTSYKGTGKTHADACGEATNRAGLVLPNGASVGACECSKDDSSLVFPWVCIVRVTIRDK